MIPRAILPLLAALLAVPSSSPAAGQVLRFGGSGGPMAGIPALGEEYRRQTGLADPSFQPTPPIGSGGGVKAMLAGSLELAFTSRPLTREEKEQGAVATRFAVTPLVLAASPDCSFPGLTRGKLAQILSGKISSWPDGRPIRLVLRPHSDSDTLTLRRISAEVAAGMDLALQREGMMVAVNDTESAQRLESTPGALGPTSLSQIVAEKRRLSPLPLDGVTPSLEALSSKAWPWAKEFYVVLGPGSSPEARAFARWLASPLAEPTLKTLGMAAPR